jgi:polysaccharide biosynthesis protein PslH
MTEQKRILILDEELPFPLNSGKRIRTYNLLKHLANRHQITYLAHLNPNHEEQKQAELQMQQMGIQCIVVPLSIPPKRGIGFAFRLLRNVLFSSLPYSVMTHHTAAMRTKLFELLDQQPSFELIQAEWTPYGQYCLEIGSTVPTLVMAHNVEAVIWQRYAEAETNRFKRWFLSLQHHRYEWFEREIYSTMNQTVAVSEPDLELIRNGSSADHHSHGPVADHHDEDQSEHAVVVDNGVDTSYFVPESSVTRERATLLFLGSLDWRPNLDAVALLLDSIFPKIRAARKDAKLWIVGRNPPEWLKSRNDSGVELFASVPDVRPFLQKATALVVPLRIGGGSRLKILEALASGLPVLSTKVGAEGLHLQPNEHYLAVDSVDQFADATIASLAQTEFLMQTAAKGREVILEKYDWSKLADRLEAIWLETIARGPSHLLF